MGKLIDPGAGDYADRLSILTLKLLAADLGGSPASYFRNERNVILTKLVGRATTTRWLEDFIDLGAVNAALWQAEDELRAYRLTPEARRAQWAGFGKSFPEQVAEVAMRIQDLNDRRAALVARINVQAGDAREGEQEKQG